MAKHIVIFFASTYRKDATVSRYTDTTGRFAAECEQTNETALKYIKWKLAQQQEEITVAYAFTTKAVQEQDFRRLRIRFKDENGKTQLAHTLNNTCVAPPRMLIAFLENHLQADGTVTIPEVLRPYMGGKAVLVPNKK